MGSSSTRGEGGIRTPDAGITDVTVFETAAFNHSATSPRQSVSTVPRPFNYIPPPGSYLVILYLNFWFTYMASIVSHPVRGSRPTTRAMGDKTSACSGIFEIRRTRTDGAGGQLPINHELQEHPM